MPKRLKAVIKPRLRPTKYYFLNFKLTKFVKVKLILSVDGAVFIYLMIFSVKKKRYRSITLSTFTFNCGYICLYLVH